MTTNHLILDFSHVYCDEKIPKNDRVHWLDCSDIAECDLYCSKRAEEEIRARIEPYGIRGIHFLDSGNYHYVTGIMTEQIKQGFSLILFDHHTDMQKPMIEHMTSCGDWAGKVLKTNPWLQQLILIGPQERDIQQIYSEKEGLVTSTELREKLVTFSAEEIQSGEAGNKISNRNKSVQSGTTVFESCAAQRNSVLLRGRRRARKISPAELIPGKPAYRRQSNGVRLRSPLSERG